MPATYGGSRGHYSQMPPHMLSVPSASIQLPVWSVPAKPRGRGRPPTIDTLLNRLTPAQIDAELKRMQEEDMRVRSRTDFKAFLLYVFEEVWVSTQGHADYLPEHIEIWCEELMDETNTRLVFEAPPDHGKSVVCVRGWHLWEMGRDVESLGAIIQRDIEKQAQKQLTSIKKVLEGNGEAGRRYRAVFPHVIPDPDAKWTQGEFFVKRESSHSDATLFASSILGTIQGARWSRLTIDDIINQQDVFSPATMEKITQIIVGTLLPRMIAGGRIVAVYTRWGPNDLHDLFVRAGFKVITMPAIGYWDQQVDPVTDKVIYGSEPLWEEYWPITSTDPKFEVHNLTRQKEDMGAPTFTLVFLCDPTGLEGDVFYPPFHHFEWVDEGKTMVQRYRLGKKYGDPKLIISRRAGLDLASSEKTDKKLDPDYTAWIEVGEDDEHNLYSYNAVRVRLTTKHRNWLMNALDGPRLGVRDTRTDPLPSEIWVEAVGFQKTFANEMITETNLPVRPYYPQGKGGKRERTWPMATRQNAGKHYHHMSLLGSDYEVEKQAFTGEDGGMHDDWIDAEVMASGVGESRGAVVTGQKHNPIYGLAGV